ncbi:YppE family protein [Bacillus carboniphilus]|uniref:YppE family protein n=1 Tax=Bacillus carboniphilus TaxID=86663 RepID=A0ABY9JZD5_9BACI|nr:YppE family protein [Bacillus carboniphilus]WLR43698.1 YppE family protein [Bacillus carboniphilus]
MTNVYDISMKLKQLVNQAEKRFLNVKENKQEFDFYKTVKPAVDYEHEVLADWKKEALNWLENNEVANLYPIQIETTFEHAEKLFVQSFFYDVSAKRWKDMKESVDYVVNQILQEFDNEEGKVSF